MPVMRMRGGANLHGLVVSANETRALCPRSGASTSRCSTSTETRCAIPLGYAPDSLARRGSNIYVTLRFAGQLARIRAQTGAVDYMQVVPPATTGWAVHGIAIRP